MQALNKSSGTEKEKQLTDLKNRFLTMASHEFRTPLSSILTSAELIASYDTAEQQDKRLRNVKRITNAVSHLTNILNEFLTLNKLEEGELVNRPIIFDLDELIHKVIYELQGIKKTGQKVIYKGLGENSKICLDKTFLKPIIFNVLTNAIKYSEKGQKVKISATKTVDKLILVIKDEGIGIPKEDQVYLFSRFFRGHNVENIPGTGLGLNRVKKYVDLLQGVIDVESELGKGTSFTIELPLSKQVILIR